MNDQTSPEPTAARRVAAIDCGTNSIRLLICDQPAEAERPGEQPVDALRSHADAPGTAASGSARPAAWQVQRPSDVTRLMRIVRLGEDVDTTGRIADAALKRTATALREYAELIERHRPQAVRMVATSASRDADNAREFRDMVFDILGVMPEVISGEEEARLSFAGAVADLPPRAKPRLVVDIGGGSTEFVFGADQAGPARSVDVGCVRMTERHLRDDPPSADQIAAAEADITAKVDEALDAVDPGRTAAELVGLAGSVTTVAALALGLDSYDANRIHHTQIGYDDVAEVTRALLSQTRQQRLSHGPMHPGRADVIAGGALVLRIIMERAAADTVLVSEHDILDGIATSIA